MGRRRRPGDSYISVHFAIHILHFQYSGIEGVGILDQKGSGKKTYVKMIPPLLRRELPSLLYEIPELRLSPLELAGLVAGRYPIGDFICCLFVSY